jgi:hypothetical protein
VRLSAWDQGFVAAPPHRVYGEVADPTRYPGWWPGATVSRDDGGYTLGLERVGTVRLRPERQRDPEGLFLELNGPIRGTMEWFLEPFQEGTIVHCLSQVDLPGGPRAARRRLRGLRVAIHSGLVGLKGRLE